MSDKTSLPVNEVFATWQGEGVNMGRAAFFIRLHGCPVHCAWCDSAGTWHRDWVPKDVVRMHPEELAQAAVDSRAPLVVITGGEPCIHNLDPLIRSLRLARKEVALETCGAFTLPTEKVDCITVSPKWAKPPVAAALRRADEFKLIVEQPESIALWHRKLTDIMNTEEMTGWPPNVWLHPEWSQRSNPDVLNAISDAVKACPRRYRAGWQLHKCYGVDALDLRSRPLVPLGGVPLGDVPLLNTSDPPTR